MAERIPSNEDAFRKVAAANSMADARIQANKSADLVPDAKEGIELRFEALSVSTLEDAKKLVNSVFTPTLKVAGRDLEKAFLASQEGPEPKAGALEYNHHYWIARNVAGEIVGVTGYTQAVADKPENAWLGWFCLRKDLRGGGTGKQLLEHVVQELKTAGKKELFILTTDRASMRDNEKFYHQNACPIVAILDRSGLSLGAGSKNLPPALPKMYADMNDPFWKIRRLTNNIRRRVIE